MRLYTIALLLPLLAACATPADDGAQGEVSNDSALSQGGTAAYVSLGVSGKATVQNNVFFYESTPAAAVSRKIGDCEIAADDRQGEGAPVLFDGDMGKVTITGGTQHPNVLTRGVAAAPASYASNMDGHELPFRGGETLTVQAAGGADFAAFKKTIVAPEPVAITSTSTSSVVEWSAPSRATTNRIDLTIATTDGRAYVSATCHVVDNGRYQVPAAVKSALLGQFAFLRADRERKLSFETRNRGTVTILVTASDTLAPR